MKTFVLLQIMIVGLLLVEGYQLSKIKYVYQPCTNNIVNQCWTNIINCEKPMKVNGIEVCPEKCRE